MRWSSRLLVIAGLLAITSVLIAHEETPGQQDPIVIPNGRQFEVYFTDDRNKSTDWVGRRYRSVFALDGTPISLHERFEGKMPHLDDSIAASQLTFENGLPYLEFGPTRDTMKKVFFQTPAKCADFCILGWLPDRMVAARFSVLSSKEKNHGQFSLGVFDLNGKLLYSAKIGTPGRIYEFAVTTPVIAHDDELLIAWIEAKTFKATKDNREEWCRVILTRWRPKDGRLLHCFVKPAFSKNAEVSIGAIDSSVLVAWHNYGHIKTEVMPLDSKKFAPFLPKWKRDITAEKKLFEEVHEATRLQEMMNN